MLKRIITALALTLTLALYITRHGAAQQSESVAVRQAIEKSLPLLDRIRVPFLEQTGCVSCHHNSLPAMAAALARERGFKINEQTSRDESEQILAIWRQGRENMLQGNSFAGNEFTAGFTLVGLAANQQPPNTTTDAIVHYLLERQAADGHWQSLDSGRPPLDANEIKTTALTLRALQLYAPKVWQPEAAARIQRARAWLLRANAQTTDELSYQLLGLGWAQAEKPALQKLAQKLLAQQRTDGGWSQLPTLASDAYATGQALVALHQAGGLPTTQRAYQRGVKYLLDTQLPDGSWLVQSRAYPFQKYFESGFPHKHNQWISAAATSWATIALTLTIEAPAPSIVSRKQP